jgi:hypothetical protein
MRHCALQRWCFRELQHFSIRKERAHLPLSRLDFDKACFVFLQKCQSSAQSWFEAQPRDRSTSHASINLLADCQRLHACNTSEVVLRNRALSLRRPSQQTCSSGDATAKVTESITNRCCQLPDGPHACVALGKGRHAHHIVTDINLGNRPVLKHSLSQFKLTLCTHLQSSR